MASQVKTSQFVAADPEKVLELLEEGESDNAGMSFDEKREVIR